MRPPNERRQPVRVDIQLVLCHVIHRVARDVALRVNGVSQRRAARSADGAPAAQHATCGGEQRAAEQLDECGVVLVNVVLHEHPAQQRVQCSRGRHKLSAHGARRDILLGIGDVTRILKEGRPADSVRRRHRRGRR